MEEQVVEIVTDSGVDLNLDPAQREELHVHIVPLVVMLDGTSYRDRLDLQAADFYPRLAASRNLPTTSQPSPGDFAEVYRRLAALHEEILSIHMSSGLSGTLGSAQAGAALVPEAKVTHVDTKTLSAASGWQVEAAARAARGGWAKERILTLLRKIGEASDSLFTLSELKYLIHGGRISHMKGLLASLLNIKPIIGVEKERGTYVQRGSARTFPAALASLVDLITAQHSAGEELRMQVVHASNPDGARQLRDLIEQEVHCRWSATTQLSLVLSAHTGPTMVGVAFAPARAFAEVPT
jgi:fatty acid kinase fatty acid binding subunit